MPQAPVQSAASGPVVVYGASGYTGRLIGAELCRRGADVVLAGRSAERLETAAAELPRASRVAVVALDDGPALRELLSGAAVVVGCAGPFTLHGTPLIEAAAEVGTNYLDTTGEQPFIRASFDRHGADAASSGAALVSGMGFDYAPGDMLAALTAAGLGRLEELTVAYSIRGFGATRGTALSALEMLGAGDLEWREGGLHAAGRSVGEGAFDFPSPIGSRRVGRYPAGEPITVPRHLEVGRVRSVIDLRALIGLPLGPLAAPALSAGGMAMATPLRAAAGELIARLPAGPSERERQAVRYTLVCDAVSSDGRRRRGVLRGSDVYATTAAIIAEAAGRMAAPGYGESGALAPSQAFEPAGFVASLGPFGISVELEQEARRNVR